jgi:S1-C subfamily serine protease
MDATPERWFEPTPSLEPVSMVASEPSGPGLGRGLVALILAASVVGAVSGGAGVYVALRTAGVIETANGPAVSQPTAATVVSVESNESTVIAAVGRVSPAVVGIKTVYDGGATKSGSGIVYDQRGWILTNKHVVEGGTGITVRLTDGRMVPASIYGLDNLTDLAIVKVDGVTGLSVAPIGSSDSLQVGELVIAIGNPLDFQYPDTVTSGIVSALGRDLSVLDASGTAPTSSLHDLIQTDAAINTGNSGGPLVDASGRIIGVATAQTAVAPGIGFAIPIDIAKPIMQQALAGEKLSRPFIGVTYELIDRGTQDRYQLPLSEGAWVHAEDASGRSIEAVVSGSPGDKAGIKTGDIITRVEGQVIDEAHPLQDILVQYAPGRRVSVQVLRNKTYLTLMVTLGTRPDSAT